MAERPDSASDTLLQRQRQEIKDLRGEFLVDMYTRAFNCVPCALQPKFSP